ncbi:GntR family transcriptional regulator [Alkalimarinus alittae]|uniref:GntR family transcriptional regulator n=1 Tax=Alkalimarinus alittae TaxID=2961619 RepID=A0ABY6N350_9ALTE|nr:GntR family transcriptional regulator [Alkalimarinus alittae]UZE96475.1 GntR family transcriptional regulator [Alkalimarinus alittae]
MQFKPKETLTEQVATHIENLIAFNQLKGGQRIYEGPMAKELSVSHGSVREALLLLEKKHLVRSIPRKGTFVTELDEHFVKSLYEAILMYLTNTSLKLVRQWKQEDIDQMESLYTQMSECFQKGQLIAFLDLGIEYTQASLAYADNYFIVSAIQDLWPSAKRCAFVALQQGTPVLKENLEHMRHSLDTIKERDENELVKILKDYADQQCRQVLQCIT